MRLFVLLMASGLLWLDLRGLAIACDYPAPTAFEIQTDAQDVTAPATPRASIERIKRGREPQREGCSYEKSSCDGSAYVLLNVDRDDMQTEPALGYVLEVKGKSPAGLEHYLNRPLSPSYDPGQLRLVWEDGAGHAHYDFDVYVWTVDQAGNMSEEPAKVHVESGDADGCAAVASPAGGGWLFALLLACTLRARRRPRPGA